MDAAVVLPDHAGRPGRAGPECRAGCPRGRRPAGWPGGSGRPASRTQIRRSRGSPGERLARAPAPGPCADGDAPGPRPGADERREAPHGREPRRRTPCRVRPRAHGRPAPSARGRGAPARADATATRRRRGAGCDRTAHHRLPGSAAAGDGPGVRSGTGSGVRPPRARPSKKAAPRSLTAAQSGDRAGRSETAGHVEDALLDRGDRVGGAVVARPGGHPGADLSLPARRPVRPDASTRTGSTSPGGGVQAGRARRSCRLVPGLPARTPRP